MEFLDKAETMREFKKGQVVRFEDGDIHGFLNTGDAPFQYVSITSPPIDFSYAYEHEDQQR